jgi:transcription initiation factor IIE alpha subunit
MSTEKVSEIFIHRIDNTYDLLSLQNELLILQRIEKDIDDENIKEEMQLKIQHVKGRIAKLREQHG